MSKQIDILFERNLKWKLLKKAYTSAKALKVLINTLRYYDLSNTGKITKDNWVNAILANGLVIGISKDDLSTLFDKYKEENSEFIDYKKFSFDLFFKNNTTLNKGNIKINNSLNNIHNQTEPKNNENFARNNNFSNYNKSSEIFKSHKQLNINNNLNNSFPLINNHFENLRYNYKNIIAKNILHNSASVINYNSYRSNTVRNSVNYFKSKININNGLNYYKLILELSSKIQDDNTILKIDLPIALQNIGIFYTQKELSNLYYALGCEDITSNTFRLSKLEEIIKDNLNDYRKNIITNIFNDICKKENINSGGIPIKSLKELFKSENHPEALNNVKKSEIIYAQFCQSLDIFTKLNNISDSINLEQFIEFYSGISSSITDDRYFSVVINSVWESKENKNENGNNNTLLNSENNPSSQKFSNLTLDKSYLNSNDRNYYNLNNYSNKDSINDQSNIHTKINLPLFYYNKNNTSNNLYQSPNNISNRSENKGNNNIISSTNSQETTNTLNDNKELNERDVRNISGYKSPSNVKKNLNLINKDLNLISSNRKTKDITPILNKLREIFILRGNKSIFFFQRMLYVYDLNKTGEISFFNFKNIIEAYNYNFTNEELNNLFGIFDQESTGFIKYNDLLMEIIGNMDILRFTLVKKLFDAFPKNENGNINIDIFKRCFVPNKHYEVLSGKKTVDEAYGEFLECLEIFIEYNTVLNKEKSKTEMTMEQFFDFFGEISFGIQNDYDFNNYMSNCWELNRKY